MSMTWNPQTHDEYDTLKGFDVYSSDNEKIGTIEEVFHPQAAMPQARGGHYFKVDPGMLKSLFGADDVFVPETTIRTVDPSEDRIILELPKSRLKDQDWSEPRNLGTFRRS
jgi:hypothetical protein